MKFEKGTILEGFQFFPSIALNWITQYDLSRKFDLQFSWLFWYFTIYF